MFILDSYCANRNPYRFTRTPICYHPNLSAYRSALMAAATAYPILFICICLFLGQVVLDKKCHSTHLKLLGQNV